MREPEFELTVNPKRLAAWAALPVGLDASDHDLGKAYSHQRYPLLRQQDRSLPDLSFMQHAQTPENGLAGTRELPAFASRDNLLRVAHLLRAVKRQRCLVPADRILGLRHHSHTAGPAYSMTLRSGDVFGLAAVWKRGENGSARFSVITTLVSHALHLVADCMPVIIAAGDRDRWLDHSMPDAPEDLLKPLSEAELQDWIVSPGPGPGASSAA